MVNPVFGKEQLLVADIDLERIEEEKLSLDTAGHYNRPDLLKLQADRKTLIPFQEASPVETSPPTVHTKHPRSSRTTSSKTPEPNIDNDYEPS